jgi:hypothetical protein
MKSQPFFTALSLLLGAWVLSIGAARADTVLYDSAGFVQGQQSFVQSFNITTPGTLTVTLSEFSWLDTISNLTGFVSTSSGVMGSTFSSGSESFSIGAGTIYAHWFGEAQGTYDIGVLGVKIMFQPNGVTAVPLPASLILLLSGLGVLLGWQRRARDPSAAPDHTTAAAH